MEFVDFILMMRRPLLILPGKNIAHPLYRLTLPIAHLIGVNLVTGRDLLNRQIST